MNGQGKAGWLYRFDQTVFDALYSRSLVYNTCWEDPAVDRKALDLGADDRLVVITSAGCNALDYALAGAGRVDAVDANPRQNALLELKLAGIRRLDFEDFFAVFGAGRHARFRELYHDVLAAELSPFAREFWSRRLAWFSHTDPRDSFYFHGLSGVVARGFRAWLALRPGLARNVHQLLDSRSLDDQRALYDQRIDPELWSRAMNWTLSRQVMLSLLGVPHPQRREVQRQHPHGVAGFIREAVRYVFRQLPVRDNYFWSLYIRGRYTRDCCPEYLKRDNFLTLKAGAADRIFIHTCTVIQFLERGDVPFTRFVLLDHMDWMTSYRPQALAEEWQHILRRAAPGARILFRSAHATPAYLDQVRVGGQPLAQRLRFQPGLAARLQHEDRVHTYAGFHIADVAPA